jgi:hypothetical protein
LNAATGTAFSLKGDPCVAIGAHVGYNAEATDATVRQWIAACGESC